MYLEDCLNAISRVHYRQERCLFCQAEDKRQRILREEREKEESRRKEEEARRQAEAEARKQEEEAKAAEEKRRAEDVAAQQVSTT